ncbi:hypothetical protein [uncultured Erythrobacter sp.]|uniref:hypothetical protein n=1 Tax=uncultured Erythrobacter sp. TaxID=263913 RepID=UPI0026112371|nr:hypothetical protein [uncultured Erythrobacter sp.]
MSLTFSAAAAAQNSDESVYAPCAQIADDSQRLACFDATYARETELLAQQAEEGRQETAANFGLSAVQIEQRNIAEGNPDAVAENGQISGSVVEIYTDNRSNKRLFILDNGQIWAETQVSRMQRHPRLGAQVTVSEASFGGYRLRVDGRRGYVDVRRVR